MIKEFIKTKKTTLLCCGPMSKNCIDASIEIFQQYNLPLILVASRNQIDSEEMGGGYVENFTTKQFVDYVRGKSKSNVFLERDHGGPYQNSREQHLDLNIGDAMASAKKSLEQDIQFGFDLLHLDPSIPIQNESLSLDKILDRLFELYGHTFEFAKQNGKKIHFELGTEEQSGYGQDLDKFEHFLNETKKFCEKNRITKPTFVVAQTGTKVMETKNVGIFSDDLESIDSNAAEHLKKALAICKRYDVLLKEHNTDYLSSEALALRPILGINACNVAPEFGVQETRGLLYLLRISGFKKEFDLFVKTAVSSNKWKKWMLSDSTATEIDKAVICGHYVFSNVIISEMKRRVYGEMKKKGVDLDEFLKTSIKANIAKFLSLLNWV